MQDNGNNTCSDDVAGSATSPAGGPGGDNVGRPQTYTMTEGTLNVTGIIQYNDVSGKVSWSEGVYSIFGIDDTAVDESMDVLLSCIHPDDRDAISCLVGDDGPASSVNTKFRIVQPQDPTFVPTVGENASTYAEWDDVVPRHHIRRVGARSLRYEDSTGPKTYIFLVDMGHSDPETLDQFSVGSSAFHDAALPETDMVSTTLEANQLLDNLLLGLPLGVFRLNLSTLEVVAVNQYFARTLGYEREDIVGADLESYFPSEELRLEPGGTDTRIVRVSQAGNVFTGYISLVAYQQDGEVYADGFLFCPDHLGLDDDVLDVELEYDGDGSSPIASVDGENDPNQRIDELTFGLNTDSPLSSVYFITDWMERISEDPGVDEVWLSDDGGGELLVHIQGRAPPASYVNRLTVDHPFSNKRTAVVANGDVVHEMVSLARDFLKPSDLSH